MKVSANGTVAACAKGRPPSAVWYSPSAGAATPAPWLWVARVTAGYTDAVPTLGWETLSADGTGGVQVDEGGRSHLVVDVDTDAETVTFAL